MLAKILFMAVTVGFVVMFFAYYFAGWFFDDSFRLTLRKTKISSAQKIFLHFRGTGEDKDRGHAIICVRLEKLSFVNIPLAIAVFVLSRVIGGKFVFIGFALILIMSIGFLLFLLSQNLTKHMDRKQMLDRMDETGLADYKSDEKPSPVSYSVAVPSMTDNNNAPDTRLTDKIKEVKSKGLLDDDIFLPFVTDVTSKFRGVKTESEFAEGTSIAEGKEALKNLAEKQLKAESFSGVNHFEKKENAYSAKADGEENSLRSVIDQRKQELDPGFQMRGVNKNNKPVGKDDTQ